MSLKFRGFSLDLHPHRTERSASRSRSSPIGALSRSEKRFAYAICCGALIVFGMLCYFGDSPFGNGNEAEKIRDANHLAVTGTMTDLRNLLRALSPPNIAGQHMVVVIAANYAYRDFALNFICNLHRLHIGNYIALAMDRATFEHLARRGAHVFLETESTERHGRHLHTALDTGDEFGTTSFLETSRRKSLLVLQVLRLGYDVLFSDVDVIWVRNPVTAMIKYPADIIIQSDSRTIVTPGATKVLPLNYNANSGLYLARSNPRTIRAFRAIIKYSRAIRRSEQKAFNYVLCGAFKDDEGGPGMRMGRSNCIYRRARTTVHLLTHDQFPNGSDEALWNTSISAGKVSQSQILAMHANYVRGAAAKLSRIRQVGFWKYDPLSSRNDGCSVSQG